MNIDRLWYFLRKSNIYHFKQIKAIIILAYLGGNIPEKTGTKEDARITFIKSAFDENSLKEKCLKFYVIGYINENWTFFWK